MRQFLLLRRASIFGVLFALLSAVPVGAIAVGGIGGRPANPDPDNPRTQSIFIMSLDRGETGKDEVLVVNNSGEQQTIRLYAVDGVVTNTGSYTCRQESDARTDLGDWISISKDEVTLADGKNVTVPFSVAMPTNADVGEHNGCIVFEAKDNTEDSQASEGGNVRVKTRQAIRVVATVPGDLSREISITNFTVVKNDGQPTYNVALKNVGNVSADVDVKVSVTSLLGNEIYSNGGGYPILSDSELSLQFVQEDTPMFGGLYAAEATVEYNEDVTKLGTSSGNTITKSSGEKLVYIKPTLAGGLIMLATLVAVVGVVVWYVMTKLRHKKVVTSGNTHVVKKNDTIQSVAEHYSMGWKRLAAINKIKAPYVLKEGQVLHVSVKKGDSKK